MGTSNPSKLKPQAGLSRGQARVTTAAGRAASWAAGRALLSTLTQEPTASSQGAKEVHGTHHAPGRTLSATGRKVVPAHPASAEGLHSRQEEAEAGSGNDVQPLSIKEEMLHAGGIAVVEASPLTAGSAAASYAHELIVLRVSHGTCTIPQLCHQHMHWRCSPCTTQIACSSCLCCCRGPPDSCWST